MQAARPLAYVASCALLSGCFALLGGRGGGVPDPPRERVVDAADVLVPDGFEIEVVASGLTFPTGITFDDDGGIYVVEAGYSYGEVFTTPRVVMLGPGGTWTPIIEGGNPPWTGATWYQGDLIVSEGGVVDGGRVVRYSPDGTSRVLVDGLPSLGDHHTNGPVVGPDGLVYFGQGTATNAGVVGTDNADFGWLYRHPEFHDVPCEDIAVAGTNFRSRNPLDRGRDRVWTGAYVPFGTMTYPSQVIEGDPRCGGAVLRVDPDGGPLEVFAWGMRNPFGLAFHDDGSLYVTDNGYDVRGSRPVFGPADWLRRVEQGSWHGWPEFAGSDPIAQERYGPPGGDPPKRVLAHLPGLPPPPVALFGVHASADGMAFSPDPRFGSPDLAYVALFGDMAPGVGEVIRPVGFQVARVDVRTGVVEEFVSNAGDRIGPATWLGTAGIERPVSVRFDPRGESLYIVDFGIMGIADDPIPVPGTGVVWKVTSTTPRSLAGRED